MFGNTRLRDIDSRRSSAASTSSHSDGRRASVASYVGRALSIVSHRHGAESKHKSMGPSFGRKHRHDIFGTVNYDGEKTAVPIRASYVPQHASRDFMGTATARHMKKEITTEVA